MKTVIGGLLIPFIGTAAGAACVFFLKKDFKAGVQRALGGFAAGVMVAASIWSLIVPAIEQSAGKGRLAFLPAFIGFWMGILFLLMNKYIDTLTNGAPLPNACVFLLLVLAFIVLSLITHFEQYTATYGLVYREVKDVRVSLAERLRKLPLGYFGKRDLADLTETIMGDVNRLEHVWFHCLGYLYGSYFHGDHCRLRLCL